ncbi:MAG: hypothetical protein SCARUB_03374 [Candidatus Scalindua rubra]|uniref:Uncharacterized protein n=1 Tax=Candidatus Scalindua rubra TaxID=1872076 RepID=A0A1E3X7B7_9BACT|nr:MAG: hypothetical protein SCARUB_03374 [Candidatus Scalindua rubra]
MYGAFPPERLWRAGLTLRIIDYCRVWKPDLHAQFYLTITPIKLTSETCQCGDCLSLMV